MPDHKPSEWAKIEATRWLYQRPVNFASDEVAVIVDYLAKGFDAARKSGIEQAARLAGERAAHFGNKRLASEREWARCNEAECLEREIRALADSPEGGAEDGG